MFSLTEQPEHFFCFRTIFGLAQYLPIDFYHCVRGQNPATRILGGHIFSLGSGQPQDMLFWQFPWPKSFIGLTGNHLELDA
jgi:hypothetical protein